MCIFNFTTNTKFNEIIKNQNIETSSQQLIGCLIYGSSLNHLVAINHTYAFIVFILKKNTYSIHILTTGNELNDAFILDALDAYDEYSYQMAIQ